MSISEFPVDTNDVVEEPIIPGTNRIVESCWKIVAVLAVAGIFFLALGGGLLTENKVPYTGTVGAFAFVLAGMAIMLKSEHNRL